MIHTAYTPGAPRDVEADVCIVGTGAGGSAAAYALAKMGKSVVMLEAGSFFTHRDFTQREEQMMPRLFYDAGGRRTKNQAIRIVHGQGVGGSTLHNINLCKRIPDVLLDEWGIEGFGSKKFAPYLKQAEQMLGVSVIEPEKINRNNQILKEGIEKLGYQGGRLSHNREGCIGSGFCELGCAYDAKMNAMRVMLPGAIENGAQIFANTHALEYKWDGRKITELHAITKPPSWSDQGGAESTMRVRAKFFITSAGAVETPMLLQRSNIPDPYQQVGGQIRLHPGLAVAGVFDEPVNAWKGIPQSYECTEFLSFDHQEDRRVWILPNAAHPISTSVLLPGFGKSHTESMKLYPNLAPLSPMLHDHSSGTVRDKGGKPVIDYVLDAEDRAQLALGMRESARILLAAGAAQVILPFNNPIVLKNEDELNRLDIKIMDHDIAIVSVHPMSSVWMGNDEKTSCLDATCRYHHIDNLYIADTSVYPSSIGVPPQVSTYSIGLYVGKHIAKLI